MDETQIIKAKLIKIRECIRVNLENNMTDGVVRGAITCIQKELDEINELVEDVEADLAAWEGACDEG